MPSKETKKVTSGKKQPSGNITVKTQPIPFESIISVIGPGGNPLHLLGLHPTSENVAVRPANDSRSPIRWKSAESLGCDLSYLKSRTIQC